MDDCQTKFECLSKFCGQSIARWTYTPMDCIRVGGGERWWGGSEEEKQRVKHEGEWKEGEREVERRKRGRERIEEGRKRRR